MSSEPADTQMLRDDGQLVLLRQRTPGSHATLLLTTTSARPPQAARDRLKHEYALRERLAPAWSAQPLELDLTAERPALLLSDPGGTLLAESLGAPWPVTAALQTAIAIARALGGLHASGLIHGDLRPANVLVDLAAGRAWLTGFGLASALPRERRADDAPLPAGGSLSHMAPEQSGRMNRSVDARSDLYALGVCLYQLLTGTLPFTSSDTMGWVHAHIARQPASPCELVPTLPPLLAAIALKLLAKAAEDRYQTATGLEADLRRGLQAWQSAGRIEAFVLGAADLPRRPLAPGRLYGRERELQALHAALARVAAEGRAELMLVSGFSGIGKSSLVEGLQAALPASGSLFVSGKADQYLRELPCSTLAQALRALLRVVAGQPAGELAARQAALLEAVGPDGQVLVQLLPELEQLLGRQPPLAELPARDAQARFQRVLRRFLQVFAAPGRPLVLFFDDLQWVDAATLALIAHLATDPAVQHLLVIGAYRNSEVGRSHPLARALDAIRAAGAAVHDIALAPLGPDDMARLVAETLHGEPEHAAPLARLVHERTAGNPFFAAQFVTGLAEEGLLVFDGASAAWQWDLARIEREATTANVVDLMVAKVGRQPAPTRQVLQHLACLGIGASAATLGRVCGCAEDDVHAALWPAVGAGLVLQLRPGYRFVHDRVQEAAYAMVPEPERAGLHLKTGRLLAAQPGALDDGGAAIFEIVNQLNLGQRLLASPAERDPVAQLNLDAARRARAATAWAAALAYAQAGLALLGASGPQRCHAACFELGLIAAECEVLLGRLDAAEQRLLALLPGAESAPERAAAYRLLIALHVLQSAYAEAVACALDCLQGFGIAMAAHPAREALQLAYGEVLARLGSGSIEALIDLPRCSDPAVEAAMNVLAELFAPACFTDETLALLHLCHMVRLTLAHGITPASAQGLAWFGILVGHRDGRHRDAYRFACLSRDLVERHGFVAFEAKALFALEIASVRTEPLSAAVRHGRAAFTAGAERGDLAVACFACHHIVNDMLVNGDALDDVAQEIAAGLAFVRRAGFRDVVDELLTQQRFVQALRGRTASLATLDGDGFDELAFERALTAGRMPTMIFWYWVMKAQARFMAGRFEQARDALASAGEWLWSSPVHVQYLNYHLFSVLTLAALAPAGSPLQPAGELAQRLAGHLAQLARWSEASAEGFEDTLALAQAELARIEGRELDAERGYERAIAAARRQGFVQREALAHELAARFHAGRGFAIIGQAYLAEACYAYERWGATGKLRQLEQAGAALREEAGRRARAATPSIDRLDLATVVKVSQAVSGEIELDKLVETLMAIALQHAGAERGLLLLAREGGLQVEAQGTTRGEQVEVLRRGAGLGQVELPDSLLQHAAQRGRSVLLDDASAPNPFQRDPYLARHATRSVLCLPLMKQARLIGLLYLENNLATHAFTPERSAVLELLASQAAISLENAQLYADLTRENHERRAAEQESERVNAALQESEGRFRRMADATPDVIWITDLEPERVLYASPSFERIWGLKVEELYRDAGLWVEAIHPEDRLRIGEAFGRWVHAGADRPWEAEFRIVQPGGAVRWIHERGVFIFDAQGRPQRVSGISTDITARRMAEAALRESEQRFALAAAGSNDGIWDWDPASGRTFLSETAQRLYGLAPGEPVRQRSEWRALIVLHPADAERQRRLLEDYLEGRCAAYDGEWRVQHADGSFRWIRVRGSSVRDSAGRVTRLAGSVSDIDSQKRAEAALQQTQRLEAVGTLAGGIAHDFNNILSAILGFGEMTLRNTRAGSRLRRDVECILAAGERGRSLVERILAFSRSGVGEREPVHVEGVVREALRLLSATLPEGIRLETALDAGRAATLGDSTQVHQVLINLVTNAIQAMPEGGSLRVGLECLSLGRQRMATTGAVEAGEYLVLSVADSGAGIPAEIRDRIFDPFFTTKEVGTGTGLGLSLVHGIVTEIGGAIDVSTTAGAGSTFTVYLPRAGDVADEREVQAPALPRGAQQQVLVVDDEEPLVELATETLAGLGYLPVGFSSSVEALAAFRANPDRFDAIVTDERMPGLSGAALIRAVRELRPKLPVLLVSGYLGSAVASRAREAGATSVLGKPLSARELATSLARALQLPR